MREDEVGTFQTNIFHDFEKLFEKLFGFDLSFVHFAAGRNKSWDIFIAENNLQFLLELFVAQLEMEHWVDKIELFEIEILVLKSYDRFLLLQFLFTHIFLFLFAASLWSVLSSVLQDEWFFKMFVFVLGTVVEYSGV